VSPRLPEPASPFPGRFRGRQFRHQPPPYDWFPYAALVILVVSVVYAIVLTRHDPTLGDRVGSIVADE
jgi:Na+/H+ antiporter NhaC